MPVTLTHRSQKSGTRQRYLWDGRWRMIVVFFGAVLPAAPDRIALGQIQPPAACCLADATCVNTTHNDCVVRGGDPLGPGSDCASQPVPCSQLKWSQPPTFNPASPHPECFWGWDESSWYGGFQIVADDWRCTTNQPVTDIHWWGSYKDWTGIGPPVLAPDRFHIGLWTDVPFMPPGFSHPGVMVWQWIVPRAQLNEHPVACDFHPNFMTTPDGCFRYDFKIPQAEWFYQEPACNIFWISISAVYPVCACNGDVNGDGQVTFLDFSELLACLGQPPVGPCARADINCDGVIDNGDVDTLNCLFVNPPAVCCPQVSPVNLWGWKSREHFFMDDAVRMFSPTAPVIGQPYATGEPIEDLSGNSWDMAFVITTEPACRPMTDGSACEPTICPDPMETCVPVSVRCSALGGPCTIIDCNCKPGGNCHVDLDATNNPICVGGCPAGEMCNSVAFSQPDGSTIFTCECALQPEACCFVDGHCEMELVVDCLLINGTPQGPGTTCSLIQEACCLANGTCMMTDPLCCDDLGGTRMGPGSQCTAPQACCFAPPNPFCAEMDPLCCAAQGGIPGGPDSTCTPEGCCLPGGSCINVAACLCDLLGGLSQGTGTLCTQPEPCCMGDGTCAMIDPLCCDGLNGDPSPVGATTCLGDPSGNGTDDACETLDIVVCEPQGGTNPTHPGVYWYDVTPRGWGRCDFHIRVFDHNSSNYSGATIIPTPPDQGGNGVDWRFSVHAVGSETWASWHTPACADPLPAGTTFRFQFNHSGPSAWSDWRTTYNGSEDPYDPLTFDHSGKHPGEPNGYGYLVHVPALLAQACCLPNGTCREVEYNRCLGLGGDPQGPDTICDLRVCNPLKWAQPPTYGPTVSSVRAASTFDMDLDGWQVEAGMAIWWESSVGNPGGFLRTRDISGVGEGTIRAPGKFLGNWSDLDGRGTVQLDAKFITDPDGHPITGTPFIRLEGPGGKVIHMFSVLPTTQWQTYSVGVEQSQWTVIDGTWQGTLANIQKMVVNTDYSTGRDENGLDNVFLIGPAPTRPCFWGWDDPSNYLMGPIVADDWACSTDQPVTDVHWWGSYQNWTTRTPPPQGLGPDLFHIGIWQDIAAGVDRPFSHPGTMVHQWIVPRTLLNERYVGCDEYPGMPSDSCFRYDYTIPNSGEWFYQNPSTDPTVYWVSISAIYTTPPMQFSWGWKTREHFFNDDAVRIFAPIMPTPGMNFIDGFPIVTPDDRSWDMAFVLTTRRTGGIKWEQWPSQSLPGLHAHDGVTLAENWECQGGKVTDLHWWGNYELDGQGNEDRGAGINCINISIHANRPDVPWCVPQDPELWGVCALFDGLNESFTGMYNSEGSKIYQYDFYLQPGFAQVAGEIYWLNLETLHVDPDQPAIWRWQEADRTLVPRLCPAAQRTPFQAWHTIVWPEDPPKFSEMAFRVTSRPYPPDPDPTGVDKTRFISLVPGNAGAQTALSVTLASLHHVAPPYTGGMATDFSAWEGQVRWVGPPQQYLESTASGVLFWASQLQCEPYYQDWSTVGVLHVTGAEIIPSSLYDVQALSSVCVGAELGCADVSTALRIRTTRWGDVEIPYNPPSTTVQPDVADIGALVNKFKSAPGAPIKARALLAGQVPEMALDLSFAHIAACVDAFKGRPYPNAGPCVCPSGVGCSVACSTQVLCPMGQVCIEGFCRDACERCTPP